MAKVETFLRNGDDFLILTITNFSFDSIVYLLETLTTKHREELKNITLSGLVSDSNVDTITHFLKKNRSLKILSLNDNYIGDQDATQLIHATHYSPRLKQRTNRQ